MFTRKGIFQIQPWRIYNFIVPDLKDCKLKPYVSSRTSLVRTDDTYSDDLTHLSRVDVKFELKKVENANEEQTNN